MRNVEILRFGSILIAVDDACHIVVVALYTHGQMQISDLSKSDQRRVYRDERLTRSNHGI